MKRQQYFPITDRRPEDIIAFYDGETIDVGRFIGLAGALAARLPKHQYVFNLFTNRFEYLLGFCAAIIAGQCTLMPPNKLDQTLEELAQQYPDCYSMGDNEILDAAFLRELQGEVSHKLHNDDFPNIAADQLCAIAFTSGSTGKPSPNPKFWKTLRIGTFGNAALLLGNLTERLNIVATVPPQHMWGLETSILFPLLANVAIAEQTPFYPQDIAEAIESIPLPRALVSSPVHLRVLQKSGVLVNGLDRIFSATAPMSAELAKLLEKQFNTRVVEVFGSSESGILAGRHSANETCWHLSELFELEVKKTGALVSADHLPGDVIIQDVIEKIDERTFSWLGRHQDMLNIAGKRGSLIDLNRRLLAIPGVTDGVIFDPGSKSGRLAALVVAVDLAPSDIVDALSSTMDSVFLPRPVYMVSELPRQETGKLANAAVIKLYESFK